MNTTPISQSGFPDLLQATADWLTKLEGSYPVVYDDGKGIATIGIGLNLEADKANVALVLKEIGLFSYLDDLEAAKRIVSGSPPETDAERNARYDPILGRFVGIIKDATLGNSGDSMN